MKNHHVSNVQETSRLENPLWRLDVVVEAEVLDRTGDERVPAPVARGRRRVDDELHGTHRSGQIGEELADQAQSRSTAHGPVAGGLPR